MSESSVKSKESSGLTNKEQDTLSDTNQRNLIETLIKDAGDVFHSNTLTDSPLSNTNNYVDKDSPKDTSFTKRFDDSTMITTQRQREKFVDDQGYMYTFEKCSSDFEVKFWRCDQRNYGCKVRLHTNAHTNQVVKVLHSHNHDMNAMTIEVASVKSAVKKRAKAGFDHPSRIISEEIAAIGSTVLSSSINHSSLKRTIQRHRPNLSSPSPNSLLLYDPFDPAPYPRQASDSTTDVEKKMARVQDEILKLHKKISSDVDPKSSSSLDNRQSPVSRKRKHSDLVPDELSTPVASKSSRDVTKDKAENKNIKSLKRPRPSTGKPRPRHRFVDNDGYMYSFDKTSADEKLSFWRCEKRHFGCKARVHVDTTTKKVVTMKQSHNHDVDAFSNHVASIHAAVKKMAQESTEDPSDIIKKLLPNFDYSAFPALKPSNLRRMIRRKRCMVEPPPPNPTCLEELFIPHRYHTFVPVDGEEDNFLLHDSGPSSGSNRILVFGKESNLDWIKKPEISQLVYLDGTFRLSPELYKNGQMYILLLNHQGWMLPLLFALLPNKKRETYDDFFSILRQLMPTFNPSTIFMDYELGLYEALKVAFPSAALHGAPYHFAKNMYRYLASLPSALKRYRTEPAYAIKCKAVAAIAYIPVDCIDQALETLRKHLLPDLRFLVTWLQDIYVGCKSENEEKCVPLFSSEVWNANQRMMCDQDKMTNHAEGAFRRLKNELGIEHANFWKLIENLKKVQRSRDADYQEMMAGSNPPQKRKRFSKADFQIVKLLRKFSNDEKEPFKMWDLLQGIAYNIDIEP